MSGVSRRKNLVGGGHAASQLEKQTGDPFFMRKILVAGACVIALLVLAWGVDKKTGSDAKLDRGKYLVENVGLCGDCHSPHDQKGEPIAGQKLQGAVLPFEPKVPMPVWAGKAPALAGLAGLNDADVVSLLSTGSTTKGIRPRPPMPSYRFTKMDAEAIVVYLKSVAPPEKGTKGDK